MDEAKADEIRAWLLKALHDLQSAEWLLARPDPLCSAAGFHCQQAGEKALKAYLTWRDEPFERTHSLVALIAMCLPFDASFNALRSAATTLTPYAVALRYPGDLPELTEVEAREALILAREVWDFVLERLPPEVRVENLV
ncbi:MAG: HEPN domain-containing protein [Anaerolineae bacterium]